MRFDERSSKSCFELEAEAKVRQMMARGQINSARAYSDALDGEMAIARAREAREQEARRLADRQARAAETGNQFSERQVNLAEDAILLAIKADRHSIEANRLSKLAIGIGIASFIVALMAVMVGIFK